MTDILLTNRVCKHCGAEAWVGCPVAEHPHFATCPELDAPTPSGAQAVDPNDGRNATGEARRGSQGATPTREVGTPQPGGPIRSSHEGEGA